jgi:hypothetical protein
MWNWPTKLAERLVEQQQSDAWHRLLERAGPRLGIPTTEDPDLGCGSLAAGAG